LATLKILWDSRVLVIVEGPRTSSLRPRLPLPTRKGFVIVTWIGRVKNFKNQRETMSNLRTLCRPQTVFSFISCRHQFRSRVSFPNPNCKFRLPSPSLYSTIGSWGSNPWFRVNQRRTVAKASNWAEQKSPYETLGNFYFQVCWQFALLRKWETNNQL